MSPQIAGIDSMPISSKFSSIILDKIRAFSFHIIVSMIVSVLMMCLVFLLWYPDPLHKAVGVTEIFLILLGVDVVIGPILTFIVFKKGKKTLRFDLAVIASLQLAALSYGTWTVAKGRPVWIVFNVDRFDVVRLNEIDMQAQKKAVSSFAQTSLFGPSWVAALAPTDPAERNKLTIESIDGGSDLPQRPNYYVTLESQSANIIAHIHNVDELRKYNSKEDIEKYSEKLANADGWLPLNANAKSMIVLVAKPTGRVLDIIPLSPWS